jgi:hypothetical protein
LTRKGQEIHHKGRRPGEKAKKERNMGGFLRFPLVFPSFCALFAFVVKNLKRQVQPPL